MKAFIINTSKSWLLKKTKNKFKTFFSKSESNCVRINKNIKKKENHNNLKMENDFLNYNAQKITVLEGLEPVRRRPGVFIGSTGIKGFHHLAYEIIDNSIDEVLGGYCKDIVISLNKNFSITIKDEGRGIPTDIHPVTGKSALETVMTILHAGGKFGGGSYKVSGGLHGVGISVVNALSEFFNISTRRPKKEQNMRYVRGRTIGDISISGKENVKDSSGTSINFKPDYQIFTSCFLFNPFILGGRLNELAFLNPKLSLSIEDRTKKKIQAARFEHTGGISEYILFLCDEKILMHEVIVIKKELKGIDVEVTLQWSNCYFQENILSFVNNIRTTEGGTHVEGLKGILTRTFNNISKKMGKNKENFSFLAGEFIREGLTAIISIKIPEPEFEGQTKAKLGNPDVKHIVEQIVGENLLIFFQEEKQEIFVKILEKAVSAYNAAEAAKKAREIIRRKSVLEYTTLPGKLADCSSRDPSKSEIFIVEGDSAGGSAKQARNRVFQAILPLRGKIINIEKTDEDKIYKNTEIQALISALGLGTKGGHFSSEQLRYRRIVIMTDADVDGAHIRTLLLTFFYRYQRRLIEEGYVYIACPPLYKIDETNKNQKNTRNYCYSEGELEYFLTFNRKKINIQRFKGLGEMMPDQLWETTMDPSKRILKKVEVVDAKKADRIFNILMGDKVFARKEFIQIHADKMRLESIDF
jgi:DNA gyrase subunit B